MKFILYVSPFLLSHLQVVLLIMHKLLNIGENYKISAKIRKIKQNPPILNINTIKKRNQLLKKLI